MTVHGLQAPHEQVPPADLLDAVVRAEHAGFAAAMCSDRFSPWSVRPGESGFAWSWLGAALRAAEQMPLGVVNAPASATIPRSSPRRSPASRPCTRAGSGFRLFAERYREAPEPAWGEYRVVEAGERALLAHIGCTTDGTILAVHNFADRPVTARLRLPEAGPGGRLTDLLDEGHAGITVPDDGPLPIEPPSTGTGGCASVPRRTNPKGSRPTDTASWKGSCGERL
ncbi:hypothetical protein ACFVTC_25765 [Streptomyces sp. NPDC057950]|uniref:hypothetical protein n=1 Tax=Streptomyces sp. NPDC057950 TaxID=3346288 RepID=UPI0036E4320F